MKYCTDCGQKLKLLEDGCFKKKYQCSNCNNKVSEKQEWLKTVGVAGSVLGTVKLVSRLAAGDIPGAIIQIAKGGSDDDFTEIG
jgi:DNA-directed RNA polymerase subunit RPC12/RpoP